MLNYNDKAQHELPLLTTSSNYEQKFSNLRPFLSITFTQWFKKSKIFGHVTFGSGGKKAFKRSEQMKKIWKMNFFVATILHPYEKKCLNLRPIISIFPPRIPKI